MYSFASLNWEVGGMQEAVCMWQKKAYYYSSDFEESL